MIFDFSTSEGALSLARIGDGTRCQRESASSGDAIAFSPALEGWV
jgi:hypothetical protein